jgi:hypothetical protein
MLITSFDNNTENRFISGCELDRIVVKSECFSWVCPAPCGVYFLFSC